MPPKTKKNSKAKEPRLLSTPQEISDAYNEDFNIYLAEANPEPLPGEMLLEPATTLASKPASEWKDKDVRPLAELLAGRIAIDGSGKNLPGANASGKLAQILQNINAPPANINVYPPNRTHPVVVPFPGSYAFNGAGSTDNAQHLIGWLQGTNQGLRAYVFNTPYAVVLY
ncbi:hypothetical protein RhiirA4_471675 [Rhizophagus irregularis]|uniref:Uncharacterized protein n=1 Tax=Rhizophagus irregularis TaxID=588596 RepID=A0A2I1H3K8_9GLOM|nr:hypothetical protein RhiirA4_471675 [Rhizophagus irregularis]